MLFLDDFLEMLDELPAELRERGDEIRRIDVEVEVRLKRNREAITDFFERTGVHMPEEERKIRFKMLQDEYTTIRHLAQRKYVIAEKMQELLKKYQTHLEKEKTNFQCEMEADNIGVTDMIEKRYTAHCEAMLTARKDRKRRHRVGSSRSSTIASGPLLSEKTNDKIQRILQEGGRLRMDLSDDSAHSALSSAIPSPAPRGRPPKLAKDQQMLSSLVPSDDCMTPVPTPTASRRRSNANTIRGTVSIHSAMNAMNRESSGRFSPNPSERSWSNAGIDESPTPTMNLMTPVFSSGPHTLQTPTAAPPLQNSAFVVSESRHGRTRKLTSRVQEMFKETLQRQRNHGNSIIALQERMSAANLASHHPHSPNTERHGSSSDEEDIDDVQRHLQPQQLQQPNRVISDDDDDDEDEDNEDARNWCFCNEKSYGEMVRCDNEECTLRWFHYPCIGMVEPPTGKWYCPRCVVTNGMEVLKLPEEIAEQA
uniref:Inhibitor of growth protein n=1 Tax=Caenorhabditis japonica TaxID=281687 RepID=A0A8R1HH78_CAEJA